ncbi:hypothetical protein WJX73_003015 [Symbiochloris irregularis]|uniref:Fe2OG dioxygenase domain-containing protein n=1 Tax=Symbiochloris irregularis TaxID=706552 RepID=A0AAW1PV44_9CHLO
MSDDCEAPPTVTLTDVLEAVESPGVFACGFEDNSAAAPGLSVADFGCISLPLQPQQAEALQKICKPAPFGRGEATVLDPAVRRSWQVDASKVHCANPEFKQCLERYTSKVAEDLGVYTSVAVSAQLYKLLLYQTGDHFAEHRDTEKADGMFATMVILLPSVYQGGELVVQHNGKSKTFDFSAANGYSLCCAAFYADCKHQLLPVQSGYRLALVYNLVHAANVPKPILRDRAETIAQIHSLAQQWDVPDDEPRCQVYVLDHQYSEDGLQGLATLKNRDRAVAALLHDVAQSGILEVFIVTLKHYISGQDVGGQRRRWEVVPWEDCEIYTDRRTVEDWQTLEGQKIKHCPLEISADDIMQGADVFDGRDPTGEDHCGYTGNAGATLSKWYHTKAILMWPRSRHTLNWGPGQYSGRQYKENLLSLRSQADQVMPQLLELLKVLPGAWQSAAMQQATNGSAVAPTVEAHMESLQPNSRECVQRNGFGEVVCQLCMPILALRLLDTLQESALDDNVVKLTSQLAGAFGWALVRPALQRAADQAAKLPPLAETTDRATYGYSSYQQPKDRLDKLTVGIETMCTLASMSAGSTAPPPPADIIEAMVVSMMRALVEAALAEELSQGDMSPASRCNFIAATVKLLLMLGRGAESEGYEGTRELPEHLLGLFVGMLLSQPAAFPVTTVLLGACERIFKPAVTEFSGSLVSGACLRLPVASTALLQAEVIKPLPPQPTTWSKAISLGCTCTSCAELSKFLAKPDEREWRPWDKEVDIPHLKEQIRKAGNPDIQHRPNSQQSYDYRGKYRKPLEFIKAHNAHKNLLSERKTNEKALKSFQKLLNQVAQQDPKLLPEALADFPPPPVPVPAAQCPSSCQLD